MGDDVNQRTVDAVDEDEDNDDALYESSDVYNHSPDDATEEEVEYEDFEGSSSQSDPRGAATTDEPTENQKSPKKWNNMLLRHIGNKGRKKADDQNKKTFANVIQKFFTRSSYDGKEKHPELVAFDSNSSTDDHTRSDQRLRLANGDEEDEEEVEMMWSDNEFDEDDLYANAEEIGEEEKKQKDEMKEMEGRRTHPIQATGLSTQKSTQVTQLAQMALVTTPLFTLDAELEKGTTYFTLSPTERHVAEDKPLQYEFIDFTDYMISDDKIDDKKRSQNGVNRPTVDNLNRKSTCAQLTRSPENNLVISDSKDSEKITKNYATMKHASDGNSCSAKFNILPTSLKNTEDVSNASGNSSFRMKTAEFDRNAGSYVLATRKPSDDIWMNRLENQESSVGQRTCLNSETTDHNWRPAKPTDACVVKPGVTDPSLTCHTKTNATCVAKPSISPVTASSAISVTKQNVICVTRPSAVNDVKLGIICSTSQTSVTSLTKPSISITTKPNVICSEPPSVTNPTKPSVTCVTTEPSVYSYATPGVTRLKKPSVPVPTKPNATALQKPTVTCITAKPSVTCAPNKPSSSNSSTKTNATSITKLNMIDCVEQPVVALSTKERAAMFAFLGGRKIDVHGRNVEELERITRETNDVTHNSKTDAARTQSPNVFKMMSLFENSKRPEKSSPQITKIIGVQDSDKGCHDGSDAIRSVVLKKSKPMSTKGSYAPPPLPARKGSGSSSISSGGGTTPARGGIAARDVGLPLDVPHGSSSRRQPPTCKPKSDSPTDLYLAPADSALSAEAVKKLQDDDDDDDDVVTVGYVDGNELQQSMAASMKAKSQPLPPLPPLPTGHSQKSKTRADSTGIQSGTRKTGASSKEKPIEEKGQVDAKISRGRSPAPSIPSVPLPYLPARKQTGAAVGAKAISNTDVNSNEMEEVKETQRKSPGRISSERLEPFAVASPSKPPLVPPPPPPSAAKTSVSERDRKWKPSPEIPPEENAPTATNATDELTQALVQNSWYHGDLSRKECEALIRSEGQNGRFVVRRRCDAVDGCPFALTIQSNDQMHNVLIRRRSDDTFALGNEKSSENVFNDIMEMIKFHRNNPITLSNMVKVKLTSSPSRR